MISDKLKTVYKNIHKETPFGKRAKIPRYLKYIIKKAKPKSIVDFGCGKGALVKTLKEEYPDIKVIGIDPGVMEFDDPLPKVDLIISTDVLEHVEPDMIDETLKEIQSKSRYVYHLISCAPAKLILPDGRNAHLIQESGEWWRDKFESLGYNIIKDEWNEFTKYSKQLKRELPVKHYYILAENTKWEA